MDVKVFQTLSPGEFLKYTGPKDNKSNLKVGRKYEVLGINDELELIRIDNKGKYVEIGESPFAKEYDFSSYERVDPVVEIQKTDCGALIDCALETNDFEWVKEVLALTFS